VPVPVLIDCDPGHDDAMAILLALASPELELLGITTVAGNQTLPKTTANALRVLEFAGRGDLPVAAGADRPLVRPLGIAADVHGETGLDGPDLPPPAGSPLEAHAVDFLAERLGAAARPVTLVAIGPLTNVALLLARYPGIVARIERLVLMGGAIGVGNVTSAAEFNIWVDPEAAARVFAADLDIAMVGLDVTHRALLTDAHAAALRAAGPVGALVADLHAFYSQVHRRRYGWDGAPVHDAMALAHVIRPEHLTTRELNVEVECASELCRGRTVVDFEGRSGRPPNARVATDVDAPAFLELLIERLSS
jgi:inosine-uridine nucleoside N-ribohydrolase